MHIYLAARFSRADELNGYREILEGKGHTITSRWLLGGHEWSGTDDDAIPPEEATRFAIEYIEDILSSDVLVAFTEEPKSGPSRGGRHVGAGVAIGLGIPVLIVGPYENVFYTLSEYRDDKPIMGRPHYAIPWSLPVDYPKHQRWPLAQVTGTISPIVQHCDDFQSAEFVLQALQLVADNWPKGE